ncbi:DUF4184 family protein [Massilia sp. Se16.2.3]|uniref:DUF4184 family protein n=1 Tax=Massilia sp. Se16.2.3 TaxID=2709303 RepID=UPI001602263D|nr:DUF4184 family protein [Massilia sp. Se16.2.3]QNA97593.1 DUF4184 family protein [Massilia sp. Se16.2.3]
MPFTLCHPAVILPLHRCAPRSTVLAALVIGSMMPDLPYFFITGASGNFSHSPAGIVLYCVPVGALVYLLYHALLRDALLDWAPPALAARMPVAVPWQVRDARSIAILCASLAIGAGSHIAWDAFTHAHTVVVDHVAVLRTPVAIGAHVLPLYNLLQHLSSLVGFLVIAGFARSWFSSTAPVQLRPYQASNARRLGIALVIVAAAVVGGLVGLLWREARTPGHVLFNVVVTSMAMAALMLVALCAGWRVGKLRARR